MHSRIFQVSKEPVTEDKLIEEYRYEDGFVGRIADYVVKQGDITEDIEWLTRCKKGIEVTEKDGITTLKIVSKRDYFEGAFENFQKLINKFSDYTLSDFIDSKNWLDFYQLKDSYDDQHAFYIDDNDEYFGIATLDEFMRNVEDGDIYYIGNTFDYHF